MDTNFKKRVEQFYLEYKKEEEIISRSNATIDARIQTEKNKEPSLGGRAIFDEVKAAVDYVKEEYGQFNLAKIVEVCNTVTSIKPISIETVTEQGDIFDGINDAKGIIDKFYFLVSNVLNMVTYLKDNSTLTEGQSNMLSRRLGEIVYFKENADSLIPIVYEKLIVPVRQVIDEAVSVINKEKEANDQFLNTKKGIFTGELQDILIDFNFYYGTRKLDEHNFEVSYQAEYKFDAFLINEDAKYQDMYNQIAEIDSEFVKNFKCRSMVEYNSTKAKTYILNGRDEERIRDIYQNLIISFLYSYPGVSKKIVYIDNQEDSLLKDFITRLDETSSHNFFYSLPIIKGEDIKNTLHKLNEHVNEIDVLLNENKEDDLFIYNASHVDEAKDIILLLINDYPYGMHDDESVDLLSAILAKSNKCGVITMINYNKDYLMPGMKNIVSKDIKTFVLKNLLPLEKGDFDEEEFFSNISLLMDCYK